MAEWLGKALQKLLQRFESARDLPKNRLGYKPGRFNLIIMPKILHYIGLIVCLAFIGTCFLPWVHYNNINETFSGFHVTKFATGNYYGKAGKLISIFCSIIFILILIPKLWAKRLNLFMAAFLFAYAIRTYIIFTSALFEGEVEKKIGIYLVLILSSILMVCVCFPKMGDIPVKNKK